MSNLVNMMQPALRSAVAICAFCVYMTHGFAQQVTHDAPGDAADAAPPDIATVQGCSAAIKRLFPDAIEIQVIKKILKKNLHFRGDRHILFPHWTADYGDMKIAFDSLTPAQLPALVALLRQKKLSSGIEAIGGGTLRIFGAQGLPCISAALDIPGTPVTSVLRGVQISILSEITVDEREKKASEGLQRR